MPKNTQHRQKMAALQQGNKASLEGQLKIQFAFGGKTYSRTHAFNPQEIKHMKDLIIEFGDQGADQVIWKMAIKGASMMAERLMNEVGLDYVKQHYKGPIKTGVVDETLPQIRYEDVVRGQLEEYVESRKPLPDSEAFSEEAAEKVQQEIMQEKL